MPRTELPITGGFYENRSQQISNQRCLNWYVNVNQGGGLAPESLFGTPGIHQIATTGEVQQANRGSFVKSGIPYFVNGDRLYNVIRTVVDDVETFTTNALGTVEGTARVSMASNGTQLFIMVPGGKGYIFNEDAGTPFQEIIDADFTANGAPQFVVFIDGFFVLTTDSKKFINSALNDGLTYSALDFGTAEANPDDIVAPIVHNNQLFIGGSTTIEVFQNIGGSGFPFQRVEGYVIPKGIFAPSSIVKAGDTYMFIGGSENESPSIMAFDGNNVIAISTDGIDQILQGFTDTEISEAFAWYYSQAGSRFVGFVFPSTTIVFDTTSKKWHERGSLINDGSGTRNIRWRANSLVTAYNRVLVGDSQDGRIGEVDLDFFDEYDGSIIREVSIVPLQNLGRQFSIPSLELTMEAGVGDLTTIDPVIRMSISKDGFKFGSELSREIGKIGEFQKRSIWRRLGRFTRFGVLKFVFSEKVKAVIIKLEADIV